MTQQEQEELARDAIEMIKESGRTVQRRVVTNTGSEFDPTFTSTDTPIQALFTNYSSREIDGTLIKVQDKKMLTTSEVKLNDCIVDGGVQYQVIPPLKELKPGNVVLLYTVNVRI